MPTYESGITWSNDNALIGTIITFPDNSSSWKLERKIVEHEYCDTELDAASGRIAEARA